MSYFEAAMIIMFGIAWPANLLRTFRSKNLEGKSLMSNLFFIIGYLCGIAHKLVYNFDWVIIFYSLNLLMVVADTAMAICKKQRRYQQNVS